MSSLQSVDTSDDNNRRSLVLAAVVSDTAPSEGVDDTVEEDGCIAVLVGIGSLPSCGITVSLSIISNGVSIIVLLIKSVLN